MKPARGLGTRLALTVLPVIVLFVASSQLLLPGLDDAVVRKMHEPSPFASTANVGVFALGVMSFVQAYALVELVALAVPRLRRLRHGNPEGRLKLDRAARALGLVLATFQAFGIAMSLRALSSVDLVTSGLPSISLPLVTATLVGGACVSMLVADLVTRQGILNGLLLLPCIDLVVASIADVRTAMAKATVAGTWEARHWIMLGGTVLLALFAGWAATRGAHDVRATDSPKDDRSDGTAYRDARALILRPWVPVPSSSIAPYAMAASILMLPATLANLKLPFFDGLAGTLERGDLAFTVSYAAIMAGLVFVLTRVLHRPADAEDLARRLGTQVDPTEVIAAQNRALVPSLVFFALLVLTTHAAGRVPFLHLSLAMLPVASTLALDAVRSLRIPTDFVGVWQERRAAAVPVVRAVLEARGIETRVTGAATNALFQAFAPYAPVSIHVPATEAERATKILRHLLLGDEAPDAAPERKLTPERRPAWSMRTRSIALGAALVAACGLVGLGFVRAPAPPPRVPPKLEVMVVADDTDVFAKVPDADVPAGVDIRFENVPLGFDDRGSRLNARNTFASVDLQEGETLEQAIARGEAWTNSAITLPAGMRIAWEPTYDWNDETGTQPLTGARTFVLAGDSWLSNSDVVDATAAMDSRSGMPEVYVAITLTDAAGERFRELTATHVNRRIAIVLDGRINSAPVVRTEIGGGRLSITMGAGDPEKQLKEARALAAGLTQH